MFDIYEENNQISTEDNNWKNWGLGLKQRIVNFLKYNKYAYKGYYYVMSSLINIMKVFLKPDDKLILFNSFAGRKYNDSPKAIFEVMKRDPRFRNFKFVWAFHEPEKFEVHGGEKIRTDGYQYFKTALEARVWITNSSVERGLSFKGKKTFYFNTWHGTPIKLMGSDLSADNQSFAPRGNNKTDIMMSQGRYETEIFSRTFGLSKSQFLEAGLPRNDILADYTEKQRAHIGKKISLQEGKTVILYCPTFREFEKDENLGVVMAPPIDLQKWEKELGEKYILLIRAHYEVSKVMNIGDNAFVRNMTEYPDLNDLFIASDILLSDYSSVFFDYSITGKPMLHFTYDFDEYMSKRGLYFDIRDYLDGGATEEEVIEIIKRLDEKEASRKTEAFRQKYVEHYGHASQAAVDCIAKNLQV